MTDPLLPAGVRGGVYAGKQLLSGARLVTWSHSRRFRTALALAQGVDGKRVLDYGCGDGSFLAMLLASGVAPAAAVGADIAADLVADCQKRLSVPGLRFVTTTELEDIQPQGFDVVFCMEVLEHVLDREELLDRLYRQLVPGGRLLISVPVETGLPLVLKQTVRTLAGWRGIGDYPGTSPYRIREWVASLLAGPRQHIVRPVHTGADGTRFHDHKGFNWMALREQIARRFILERVLASPFEWLPPHLGTQAWFIGRRPVSLPGPDGVQRAVAF